MGTKHHAAGTFELKWEDHGQEAQHGNAIGRAHIVKSYAGDLAGTGHNRLMTAGTSAGPACYVALEFVEGTLHGRTGGFLLQHSGGMEGGKPWVTVRIVETSGFGELEGIRGTGTIVNDGGAHTYTFDYELD